MTPDFGLDDWPPRGRGSASRELRMHAIYLSWARKAGIDGSIFTASDAAARDGWNCSACGDPVPQRWAAEDAGRAPALAFAVPLDAGGRYELGNARLAHFGCAAFPDAALKRRVGALLVRDLAVKAHAAPGDDECPKGHELAGGNLLPSRDGRRRCRQCRNDRARTSARS
jgi:hypothetical protein